MFCSLARLYFFVWCFLYMFAGIFFFFSSRTLDTFSVERAVRMYVICLIE